MRSVVVSGVGWGFGQGVANDGYFLPGPAQNLELRATLIEKNSPPDILVHGLITPEDVDKLFDM